MIYLCLHGEAPPPVESRRQGAPLKRLAQPDNISLALQTVSTHCLQLDLQARPKNAAQLLAELAPCWANQPAPSINSMRTIIPDQVNPNPYVSERVQLNPPPVIDPVPPPVPPVAEAGFFKKTVKFLLWAGVAGAGFVAYQNYAEEQEKISKQERRLFAEAQSLEDFQAYLEQCQICEAKSDASAKIAQIEQEQQLKKEKQEKKKQEHLAYIQAQTADDLKAYLATCEFCQDKKKAEAELKQKLADEAQAKAEAEANKPSLLETVTKPIVDSAVEVLQDAKNQAEAELKAKAEEAAKAQADAELKRQQDAEAKARVEAELKAEIEAEAKAERESRAKAEAEAKAKAEEKLKSDVENAIKRSTGIDISEIQKMIDASKK